jgi:hypothetical protein
MQRQSGDSASIVHDLKILSHVIVRIKDYKNRILIKKFYPILAIHFMASNGCCQNTVTLYCNGSVQLVLVPLFG